MAKKETHAGVTIADELAALHAKIEQDARNGEQLTLEHLKWAAGLHAAIAAPAGAEFGVGVEVPQPAAVQVYADANRFQLLKSAAFNRTVNGFDGKVLTWTLTLPADEHGDGTLEEATDQLMSYHGFKPVYSAPLASQPLAPEHILAFAHQVHISTSTGHWNGQLIAFARLVERAAITRQAIDAGATVAELPNGGIVFINRGEQPVAGVELDCPACGGSGHKDDVRVPAAAISGASPPLENALKVTLQYQGRTYEDSVAGIEQHAKPLQSIEWVAGALWIQLEKALKGEPQ